MKISIVGNITEIMDIMRSLACRTIDDNYESLNNLSQKLWLNPELGFEEIYAHDLLTNYLEEQGFTVTRSYHMKTAFKAEFGSETGPNIAVLCEYDALPEIGHACGHNLIAEVGVATGLALKAAIKEAIDSKIFQGKVTILGTPAEEGGGGKVKLLAAGAFDRMDAAMMAHPSNISLSRPKQLANRSLRAQFHGRAAHAASFPWEGVNALDAAVSAYLSISQLRQQMKPEWRVHGIISKGGIKPNIIPDLAEVTYYIRCPETSELVGLYERVAACCKAAAHAAGCTIKLYEDNEPYLHLNSNDTMSRRFEIHANDLDLPMDEQAKYGGSTDMGNVSLEVPSIHPKFFIAPCPSLHSLDFQRAAGSDEAQVNTMKVSKALALVALDLMSDPEILKEVKADFYNSKGTKL